MLPVPISILVVGADDDFKDMGGSISTSTAGEGGA